MIRSLVLTYFAAFAAFAALFSGLLRQRVMACALSALVALVALILPVGAAAQSQPSSFWVEPRQQYFVFVEGGTGSANPGVLELSDGRKFSNLGEKLTSFSGGLGARFGETMNLYGEVFLQPGIQATGAFANVLLYYRRPEAGVRPYLSAGIGALRSEQPGDRTQPTLRGFGYTASVGLLKTLGDELGIVIGGRAIFARMTVPATATTPQLERPVQFFMLTARLHLDIF